MRKLWSRELSRAVDCGRLLSIFLLAASALATPLDDQLAAFKAASAQTENAVANILKTGIQESRAAEALMSVKPWLDLNPAQGAAAQYYAGCAMEYTGDWSGAVSFYRQFLKNPSLDAALAGSVVPATYRLLINDLRQPESAYLFMREDGNRLRSYGSAKQFDGWFMAEARRRNDVAAVCSRLATLLRAEPASLPGCTADLEWVLQKLESFGPEDPDWYEEAAKLVGVPGVPPAFGARLNWVREVVPFSTNAAALFRARRPIPDTLADGPLKAAEALVAALPYEGSVLAARGWMNFREGDTPTFLRYLEPRREAKAAPLLRALAAFPADKVKSLLSSPGDPQGRPASLLFSAAELRSLVKQMPTVFNSLAAPDVLLFDGKLSVEEAKSLVPLLARNPHGHAALVRAYAVAGTNTLSAMVPAIMQSERWRFSDAKSAVDAVWNSGCRRDGAHAELAKQYEPQGGRYDQLKQQVAKSADSGNRLAAFNTLLQELRGIPSTPGLLSLWDELFKHAPPADTEKMLLKLISDYVSAPPSSRDIETQLLRQALGKADFGNAYSRLSLGPELANGWDRWGYENVRKGAPAIAAYLATQLRQQMAAGTLSEPVFGMWLHCMEPGNDEAKALMDDLVKSPAYARMNPAYQSMAAHRLIFGDRAVVERSPTDPRVVSRELFDLPQDATPAQVEAALKAVVTRVSQAPEPLAVQGLQKIAALPRLQGETRALALALFRQYSPVGDYPGGQGYGPLVARLAKEISDAKDWGSVGPFAAGLWRAAGVGESGQPPAGAEAMTALAEGALEAGAPSVALLVARAGMKSGLPLLAGSNSGAADSFRARLNGVLGKAGIALGVAEIPVDETSPDYGIYKSGAEFAQGNLDSAWSLYLANAARLQSRESDGGNPGLLRKLPAVYGFWLLKRNLEEGRAADTEALVKELTLWSRQAAGMFSLEQDAELKIAYADLAFLKGAMPTARAWYRKIVDAREYKDSEVYLRAALGSVKVDRATKNFGAALEELDDLMRLKDPAARARVHYARAEVLMDKENYKDALDEVETVLRGNPNHADALILRGKIQYEMRKLVEASEIELGVSRENKIIVPGESLKINLLDPTLSVSGVGADIEVEVRAKSGDVERVLLHPFGDSKDKFRAEVPTVLGPPTPGDKTLQVLGVDELRYGYSKEFRAKMKDLPPDPTTVIGIASDAEMAFSAGALPPKQGERRLDIEELGLSTAQRKLGTRFVRPGNPVYVRVIDPDQSRTAAPDTVAVSLRASSGDEIRRALLTETGPCTGVFEGAVPTAGAQALAFASESAPGRDPNMAISTNATYPGWMGNVGDKEKLRTFGVDLNDSVQPATMAIRFGDEKNVLTRFVLQTSMNGRDWITRARYPEDAAPWDGRPRISSCPTYSGGGPVTTPKGRELPADWAENMELLSARASWRYLAATVTNLSTASLPMLDCGHPSYGGLVQIRALFYQPATAVRRFKLTRFPVNAIFLLDGAPSAASSDDPMAIERELAAGLHEIQAWCTVSYEAFSTNRLALLCDVPGKAELQPCPDAMFDPATFPAGIRAQIPLPAAVANVPGGVDVTFGTHSQARLVRLVILGYDGVAASIKSVTLTDRAGQALLPVKGDFMALRQNAQLEVLPGDQIVARYEDPVTATPRRSQHERSLSVAFNTATIDAAFPRYTTTAEGRTLELEPIRRFKADSAIAIAVDDADMDSTPKPDTVDCKIVTSEGQSITVKAVETEAQSGRFMARVFPVAGKPQRESEIQMSPGATLTATYRDMENLDPGIPADRSVTIEYARYRMPQLAVYSESSEWVQSAGKGVATATETVAPRRALRYAHVDEAGMTNGSLKAVIGASLRFDVVAPHLALAASSKVSAYVQVAQPASATGQGQPFDSALPGTLKLSAVPGHAGAEAPAGYTLAAAPAPPARKNPLDEGRFSFSIPLILGDRPPRSFATKDAQELPASSIPDGLAVQAGDVVRIGCPYLDEAGTVQWNLASVTVGSHAFLDVMNDKYAEPLTRAYVGEKIFVRLLAPGLDRGPERDEASVALKAASGAAATFKLRETERHSGVFKGGFALSYAATNPPAQLPPVELNGFPVRYGDELAVSLAAAGEDPAQSFTVSVNRGADGNIEPFSKRFTGDDMAVKTSFTLAECFFELAKKHSQMNEESLARREIAHAQKLLAEAVATHREDALRAHAEYLLGNLAQEYADLAKNDETKRPMYQDALARFSKIPVDYPDTEFAPKAQFKTALVYEKMGETEIALEEYVKLAYKYPDCEYIPEVMSRLGGYFQGKGQAYKDKADPLREKTDAETQAEVLRLDELSYPEFLKAATIFGKLLQRFPDHELAGMAGLRAAQNFMRANRYERAAEAFKPVIDNETYDGPEIRAQAIYWCGLSYERWAASTPEGQWKLRGDSMNAAYKLYRRVTFDFPDSKWAKHARGRLADPAFEKIISLEEEARGRMLDALKEEKKRK